MSNRTLARCNRLKELAKLKRTIVFYESCHRILETLQDIDGIFGDKEIVCAIELTKKFEEIKRDKAKDILGYFQKIKPRGEFVVVI